MSDYHNKVMANNLESFIYDRFIENGIDCKKSHTNGVDLMCNCGIDIEIKSCCKYIKSGKGTRFGYFMFKRKEIKTDFDYYIFAVRENKRESLGTFKKIRLFVSKEAKVKKHILSKSKGNYKKLGVSFRKLLKVSDYELDEFIEYLRSVNQIEVFS